MINVFLSLILIIFVMGFILLIPSLILRNKKYLIQVLFGHAVIIGTSMSILLFLDLKLPTFLGDAIGLLLIPFLPLSLFFVPIVNQKYRKNILDIAFAFMISICMLILLLFLYTKVGPEFMPFTM